MSGELLLMCIMPYVQDRARLAELSRYLYLEERSSRTHVTVPFLEATTPQRLLENFKNLESLKLKGMPRASMFGLIPADWGGKFEPWVVILKDLTKLKSLHLRRVFVRDTDLQKIANDIGPELVSLTLEWCSGFTTTGLLSISQRCTNLKTFSLEGSTILEKGGEWFQALALNSRALETLSLYKTELEEITIESLERLASMCRGLKSVKICDTDLAHLRNFFHLTPSLQEFCGGSFSQNYAQVAFPARISSLGLNKLDGAHLSILYPVGHLLRKLDLTLGSLSGDNQRDIVSRCHNLEVLQTTTILADEGLEILAQSCKRLIRLRIENAAEGAITQKGLIALANQCQRLEYLTVYVVDITSEAMRCIGQRLRNLNDFRFVLNDRENRTSIRLLDDGIRALLECLPNMRRFALKVRQGWVSNAGLHYIGQYGRNITWLLLGSVGENDSGLIQFSSGCPNLRKLEIEDCNFTEQALARAAENLGSLRYMWVQQYKGSYDGIVSLPSTEDEHWRTELIHHHHGGSVFPTILKYRSLVKARINCPGTVYPLASSSLRRNASSSSGLRRTKDKGVI